MPYEGIPENGNELIMYYGPIPVNGKSLIRPYEGIPENGNKPGMYYEPVPENGNVSVRHFLCIPENGNGCGRVSPPLLGLLTNNEPECCAGKLPVITPATVEQDVGGLRTQRCFSLRPTEKTEFTAMAMPLSLDY
jgi:hypothetical protein